MDESIQELQASAQTQMQGNFFGKMLLMSLLLHAAVSVCFLSGGHHGSAHRSLTYLDLTMIAPAAPVKTVKATAAPAPVMKQAVPPIEVKHTASEFDKLQHDVQQNLK